MDVPNARGSLYRSSKQRQGLLTEMGGIFVEAFPSFIDAANSPAINKGRLISKLHALCFARVPLGTTADALLDEVIRFVPLEDVASMVCTYSEGKWWLILNQPLHDPTQLFKVGVCIRGRNISVSMHTSLPEVGAEWTQYCWNPPGDFPRNTDRWPR